MNDNFEDLFKEVKINKYIKTVDDELYLPSKNEMKLKEKGFNIDEKIMEKLLSRYRVETKKVEKNKPPDRKNEFIKENWFKVVIVITLIVIAIVYIMSNRYYFVKKDVNYYSNIFHKQTTKQVMMKCDKFTGECEETK